MDFRHALWAILREIIQTALISLAIFLFVYIFLVQPHRVKGGSMLPTFHDGELLLTEKISYYFGKPQRGDVLVFEAPSAQKVDFIKRIIGLPGETVTIKDGSVLINNQKLIEDYTNSSTLGSASVTLTDDEYFVLGDNRNSSSDSRAFGPVKRNSFRGRAWLVYWPIFKTNQSNGIRFVSKTHYSIPDTFDDL